jgi:oxysterol-binding protein 1
MAGTPELALNMQGTLKFIDILITVNRETYAAETTTAAKDAINRRDYKKLEKLLNQGRAKALLHMNRLDIETGSTFLHDAARRGDKRLIEMLLAHGADPIRRDRKGKLPYEVARDPDIRNILRASQPAKPTSVQPVPGEPISQKGYLKKWTNYATGSKLRWFVLDNTKLSYYKNPGQGFADVCLLQTTQKPHVVDPSI